MGRYKESMEYAKKADASGRYNRAFERYRSQWLRAHLTAILILIVLLIAGLWGGRRFLRKRKEKALAIAKAPESKAEGGTAS